MFIPTDARPLAHACRLLLKYGCPPTPAHVPGAYTFLTDCNASFLSPTTRCPRRKRVPCSRAKSTERTPSLISHARPCSSIASPPRSLIPSAWPWRIGCTSNTASICAISPDRAANLERLLRSEIAVVGRGSEGVLVCPAHCLVLSPAACEGYCTRDSLLPASDLYGTCSQVPIRAHHQGRP